MTEKISNEDAEAAGRAAYRSGQPCVSPDYGWGDRRANWRIGWKKECAAAGRVAAGDEGDAVT